MPSLLASCEEYFETKDLYSVLGVPKSASESEVKRAYHKGSLRYHPDRVEEEEKDAATKKFQTLGKVYALLSDKEKRAVYDESGEVDEDDEPQDRNWDEYWRRLFPKITLDDVKKFEEKYKGSEEEIEDLKAAYTQYNGDMDRIMESVLCCTYEDEDRFQDMLRNLIKSGDLPSLTKFSRETKAKKESRKKRMQQEAAEADELGKELGLGEGEDELKNAIQKRQESRQKNLIEHLEEKYAKKGKGKAVPKKKKLSSEEVECDEDNATTKSSAPKKNGKAAKEEASESEVSEEEKPVTSKRGRKAAADKNPASETAKESKPSRGKRGGADKAAEPEATIKQRSRRTVAAKEPKYTDDNSSDDAEEKKVVKPKGRKAAAKIPVDLDAEAEKKPIAKPKRGAAKQSQKPGSKQVETAKASKSARNKKEATKLAKESSEEEEEEEDADPKATGDGEQVAQLDESDENIPSNGYGDGHDDEEAEATKTKRTTSQKNAAKNSEKIEPPVTKKSKVEMKSKKAKK